MSLPESSNVSLQSENKPTVHESNDKQGELKNSDTHSKEQPEPNDMQAVLKLSYMNFQELNENIKNAASHLRNSCTCLRKCYVDSASSVKEFVDLRGKITNNAKVYTEKILPFAVLVVRGVKDWIETYEGLPFEIFKEDVNDFSTWVSEQHKLSHFTARIHEEILKSFKIEQRNAINTLKALEENTILNREQATPSRYSANFNYFLANSPFSCINKDFMIKALKELCNKIAKNEEAKLAEAAARSIDELDQSIEKFIRSVIGIKDFFNILKNDLSTLVSNPDDEQIKMHYDKCKNHANVIINNCISYISIIPYCETDLQAIPDEFDKNYVEKWFEEKNIEINGQQIPLSEWGKELFVANNSASRMLS
ncbi:7398_t:CDS:1 [Acaulospora morrowiae]|uniref:7398_t:CDS:1 n=1 Tax=Acaulospora morrowiae TaxID=94023 RepID=A0A9N9A8J3_9GLOM|nr:7398_t:CDS:1 [Acaulospora morrowiae]